MRHTELILIRHGQSDYNRDHRYCGNTDIGLNPVGIKQALCLRKKLAIVPDVIYSSDLARALQTARIIFPHRRIVRDRQLREINFGAWEGLTYRQVRQQYPDIWERWLDNPYKCLIPKAESVMGLEDRAMRFLNRVLRDHQQKRIVWVAHAGPIMVLARYLLDMKKEEFWQIRINSASASYFKFDNKILVESWLNKT